jgi:hypothetical protein
VLWPYRSAAPRTTPARLDRCLPPGAWRLEHHAIDVPAAPETALAAALAVGVRDMPVVHTLFSLRGLPHDATGSLGEFFSTPPFLVLDAERDRELVFGVVGPFWQWRRGKVPPRVPATPEEFRAALAEGRMAALGNFRVEPGPAGVRLWTETWVFATGARQTIPFVAYWLAIGPFSAWIRRLMLRAARRRATASTAPPGARP